jgi:hypothetical protein
MSSLPTLVQPPSADPGDFACFERVMWHLHEQGFYAPPIPWGTNPQEGLSLIPPERRTAYLYATESAFVVAFAWHSDEIEGQASHQPNTPTMQGPLVLHWAGAGTVVAKAFYDAGFFVRWDAASTAPLWIHQHPFDQDAIPIWSPTAWAHLMDTLRLLQTKGYNAPQAPTIGVTLSSLGPHHITFGMLEQTIARYGTFTDRDPAASDDTLKIPLFLTWQGDGAAIATTFYRGGCDVWWTGEADTLMGVAPRTSRLRVLSPHFPPWHPLTEIQ